jgi:tetrahydromethanopterin S-methyltransferase subunit B
MKNLNISKKQKWFLAFALASIIIAPQAAFASVVTSVSGATTPTITNVYSCANGDTLNGTNCVTPVVHHPAVTTPATTSTVPAQQVITGQTCGYGNQGGNYPNSYCANNYYGFVFTTSYGYGCATGTLNGTNCIVNVDPVTTPAYDTGGSTYSATVVPTQTCSNNSTLVDGVCTSSGATVLNTGDLKNTVFGFITGNLLTGIVGLLVLAISITLALKAVRKYARA